MKFNYKRAMQNRFRLKARVAYWKLTEKEWRKRCNGAGPKKMGWLVPDTLWGLRISEAAHIHDDDYTVGGTKTDKKIADWRFLDNMIKIIQIKTRWNWLKRLRTHRAKIYYMAVKQCGMPAFNLEK